MPIEWPDWTRQSDADDVFYRACPKCGAVTARMGFKYHRCPPAPGAFNPASRAAEMAGVPGRITSTTEDDRERAFVDLSPYRDGVITLGKFSGSSQWERHPDGDEIVQVIDGEIVLRVEHDSIRMQAGDMIVIPADRWHQIYAPDMASILYVTPRPTIHFEGGDPMGRQLDPLSGPGEWILATLVRVSSWLRRE